MMKKYFVVSDIHSFYDELIETLYNSNFNVYDEEHILIVCGDAFDRGEQSVKVYKLLKHLADENKLIYIYGNHEHLLFDAVKELREYGYVVSSHHYSNGTVKTMNDLLDANLLDEVLEFISKHCIDYYELNNYIFVHGWIPYVIADGDFEVPFEVNMKYIPKLDAEHDGWKRATWYNGMEAWSKGIRLDNKTIICGHWHCSWGNHFLHKIGSGDFNGDSSFEPFIDDGIIAIDGCTAYTHKVNILVIDENGELLVNGNKVK